MVLPGCPRIPLLTRMGARPIGWLPGVWLRKSRLPLRLSRLGAVAPRLSSKQGILFLSTWLAHGTDACTTTGMAIGFRRTTAAALLRVRRPAQFRLHLFFGGMHPAGREVVEPLFSLPQVWRSV